jgi:hypothetical protein
VPGLANDAADRLSRFSASGDYAIGRLTLRAALTQLGVTIGADLFATRGNTLLRSHKTRFRYDGAASPCRSYILQYRSSPASCRGCSRRG